MYTYKYKLHELMIQEFGEKKDVSSYRTLPLGFSRYFTVNSGLQLYEGRTESHEQQFFVK